MIEQTRVEVDGGDTTWAKPENLGLEVAVWIRPSKPATDGGSDGSDEADGYTEGQDTGMDGDTNDAGQADGEVDAGAQDDGGQGSDFSNGDSASSKDGKRDDGHIEPDGQGCGCSIDSRGERALLWLLMLLFLARRRYVKVRSITR